MRPIKFRGKRLDNGEWIYGDLCTFNGSDCEICDWNTVDCSRYDIDPETVGQFTGLFDKNGVEIYEGDICVAKTASAKFSVEFSSRGYNFMACSLSDRAPISWLADKIHGIEIISNIHDNPELLTNESL